MSMNSEFANASFAYSSCDSTKTVYNDNDMTRTLSISWTNNWIIGQHIKDNRYGLIYFTAYQGRGICV